jgi:hypothetical protein
MTRLHPKRVLEFGPGSSTLALIEGGASKIDTCEDDPKWEGVYRQRLEARYPAIVKLHAYQWSDPISISGLDREAWDLGLIDGPLGTPRRFAAIEYCVQRCAAVLVPTEDDGRKHKSFLRPIIEDIASRHDRAVEYMETGPLSGGFALLTSR